MLPRHTKRTETSCLAFISRILEEGATLEGFESGSVPLNLWGLYTRVAKSGGIR